jgi:hypothetical protein
MKILLTEKEILQTLNNASQQEVNPYRWNNHFDGLCKAQVCKIIKWMETPCTRHLTDRQKRWSKTETTVYHKFFEPVQGYCKECWKELRESVK